MSADPTPEASGPRWRPRQTLQPARRPPRSQPIETLRPPHSSPTPRDLVTGLPGQIELEAILNAEAMHHRSYGLLVIAIPIMTRINNALGHHVGDLVAATVAARLSSVHPDAVMAPLSGGNFGLGLLGVSNQEDLSLIASAVSELGQQPVRVGATSLNVPMTMGTTIAAPGTGALTALRDAGVAVQGALDRGVPILHFSPSLRQNTSATFELSCDLRNALASGQIQLFVQPQVDLRTGKLVGAEGLARWQHPHRGLLAPSDFLEAIELSDLFERFTRQMLNFGIDALDQLQSYGQDLRVSVNTPLRTLRDSQLINDIAARLTTAGVAADRFVVEITESSFSDPAIDPSSMVDSLRHLGIGVSLDDFGTEYSSLSRLADLEVSELKIDKSFVRRLGKDDPRAGSIVGSIIELAHRLGLYVVAEGIETPAQRTALVRYGCEIGQGYLFGKPVPLQELLASLRRPHRDAS